MISKLQRENASARGEENNRQKAVLYVRGDKGLNVVPPRPKQ